MFFMGLLVRPPFLNSNAISYGCRVAVRTTVQDRHLIFAQEFDRCVFFLGAMAHQRRRYKGTYPLISCGFLHSEMGNLLPNVVFEIFLVCLLVFVYTKDACLELIFSETAAAEIQPFGCAFRLPISQLILRYNYVRPDNYYSAKILSLSSVFLVVTVYWGLVIYQRVYCMI
jgi:hypothetical protein